MTFLGGGAVSYERGIPVVHGRTCLTLCTASTTGLKLKSVTACRARTGRPPAPTTASSSSPPVPGWTCSSVSEEEGEGGEAGAAGAALSRPVGVRAARSCPGAVGVRAGVPLRFRFLVWWGGGGGQGLAPCAKAHHLAVIPLEPLVILLVDVTV